jgi:citrate lyase beta subunit
MEREDTEFHARVAEAFAAAAGDGVVHLDGCRAPEQVLEAAFEALRRRSPETFGAQ